MKLGDDILAKFEGNEAKAKFNINTTHKFTEKSLAEYLMGVQSWYLDEGDVMALLNLLDGEITHQIQGEVVITRSEGSEYYNVTYTGEGKFGFNGNYVSEVKNFNYAALEPLVKQKLTLDDLSTDNTQLEGTVRMNYSTKLK